jgi:predicted nucleic-acid-binding protein
MQPMIALDTNLLARFYVDDPNDLEAAQQRPIARRILSQSPQLFVPLSVVLELEWVLRAFYGFGAAEFRRVMTHLLGLPHVHIEQSALLLDALDWQSAGLDFADALHLRASQHCEAFYTFDARRFARRAARLEIKPVVIVPTI